MKESDDDQFRTASIAMFRESHDRFHLLSSQAFVAAESSSYSNVTDHYAIEAAAGFSLLNFFHQIGDENQLQADDNEKFIVDYTLHRRVNEYD